MQDNRHSLTDTRHLTTLALLLAVSLILSWLENFIFSSVTLPGIKLGLSNAPLTVVVYLYGAPVALLFAAVKSLLSLSFTGRLASVFFSLTGTLAATSAMLLLSRSKKFSVCGVSISGAVFHVWGQLCAAAVFTESLSVLSLSPLLTLLSVVSGVLISFPVRGVLKFLKNNARFR